MTDVASISPRVPSILPAILPVRAKVLRVGFGVRLVAGGLIGLEIRAILADIPRVLPDVLHVGTAVLAILTQILPVVLNIRWRGRLSGERRGGGQKREASDQYEHLAHATSFAAVSL